jgi:hypothetical protein
VKKLWGTIVLLFWLPISILALSTKEWSDALGRVWSDHR